MVSSIRSRRSCSPCTTAGIREDTPRYLCVSLDRLGRAGAHTGCPPPVSHGGRGLAQRRVLSGNRCQTPAGQAAPSRDSLPLHPAYSGSNGIAALPIDETDALHLSTLPSVHRDPFDRLLVSQSICRGLVILTPDPLIHAYPVRWEWCPGTPGERRGRACRAAAASRTTALPVACSSVLAAGILAAADSASA